RVVVICRRRRGVPAQRSWGLHRHAPNGGRAASPECGRLPSHAEPPPVSCVGKFRRLRSTTVRVTARPSNPPKNPARVRMLTVQRHSAKVLLWVLVILCAMGLAAVMLRNGLSSLTNWSSAVHESTPETVEAVHLVPEKPYTLGLSESLVKTLDVRTAQVKRAV